MHFSLLAKRFISSIHATYSYRYWCMLNRREVLFFVSRKLASLFTYTCHENRLSRKMVWNAQFVVIITTPLLTPVVTLRDKYLPGLKVKSQQHLILNLQYMLPENRFTMKRGKKEILTLWTQALSSSLKWKYVLHLGKFLMIVLNRSLYQFGSNMISLLSQNWYSFSFCF